jgi:glucans biosynthesis protein
MRFRSRALLMCALAASLPAARAAAFGLDDVVAKARQLAQQQFHDTKDTVPSWLLNITYDEWRDIRFRPEKALWAETGSPFRIQFFHPGLFYDRSVTMNVVDRQGAHPFPYSSALFDYGKNTFASRIPPDLGYAGFRVHYPLKIPNRLDEVIVFLGASYFRAVGRDEGFGLSARGLAIDTGLPTAEEFPFFREWWLVTPAVGAKQLELYALLDSPSATGAYHFVVTPGVKTTVAVDSTIFLRKPVQRLGIAPLTSMFFLGENTLERPVDFRPEVHDSDGLSLHLASGEWLWRPLENPKAVQVNSFQATNPRGFGLMQRDRDFAHYEDLETRAELRPSAWVEPRGDWGDGTVQLVEIPTSSELNDNIVSFWTPREQPKPGEPLSLSYVLSWYGDDPEMPPAGRVVASRHDYGKVPNVHRFVLDFAGGKLASIPASEVLRGVVTILNGEEVATILDQHVVKNDVTGGWRLSCQIQPQKRDTLELRAFLEKGGEALTETWSYAVVQ